MSIFVTGGSRGIGKAIVLAAAQKGYDVAFTYLKSEPAAKEVFEGAQKISPKNKFKCYSLDIKSSTRVEEVYDSVIADFGSIDAVICNAGINRDSLIYNMTDEQWKEVIDTNLTGNFYVIRQFLPEFIAQRDGRFVIVSSIVSNGGTGQANYGASKAGLVGLSGTVAKEYGPKGVLSNIVVPGFFDTDMTRDTMPNKFKEFWKQYCPLKRIGKLEEITEVILFLASKQNGFINGQVIPVTGGLDWCY